MRIIEHIEQGSDQWHEIRDTRATGSEFGKIFTGSGKLSTQRENYMRLKSIGCKHNLPRFKGNKWTERGHELEPIARQRFIDETSLEVTEAAFIHAEGMAAGFSPDGLIMSQSGSVIAPIEIKCYGLDKHLAIYSKGTLPVENKPQVHGGMFCTETDVAAFVIYCPEAFPQDFKIIEVKRDSYTEKLHQAIKGFEDEMRVKRVGYIEEYERRILNATPQDMIPTIYELLNGNQTEGESIL